MSYMVCWLVLYQLDETKLSERKKVQVKNASVRLGYRAFSFNVTKRDQPL